MTTNVIAIGCQQHFPKEWENFNDETIEGMNREALSWWKEHKDLILETYRKHF